MPSYIKNIVLKNPASVILLPYMAGILTGKFLEVQTDAAFTFLFISITALAAYLFTKKRFTLYLTLPLFFFIGLTVITPYTNKHLGKNHLENIDKNLLHDIRIEGVVTSNPDYSKKQIKLKIDTKKVLLKSNKNWQVSEGMVLLKIKNSNMELHKGDTIAFLTKLREAKNFGNPNEFDYQWWLKRQSISYVGTADEGLIIKTTPEDVKPSVISLWRTKIRNFLNNNNFKNHAILKALIIGEKSDISKSVRDSFAKTGTSHLLAISGLHMGLVAYLSFFLVVNLLKTSNKLILKFNIIKTSYIIAIIPVIIYGLLSGFQISALRSAIMVILFALTLAIGRTKNHYNTLSLAALIILIIYPTSLWDISFQLSFAAVFFIIYILSNIKAVIENKKIITPTSKLYWLYTLTLITIAANIGTAPITAYYFNMISFAGLLANLIVVPIVSTAAVPLSLLAAIVLPLSESGAYFLLSTADSTINIAKTIIFFIENNFYTHSFVVTPRLVEIILYYSVIITTVLCLKSKINYRVPITLTTLIIITSLTINLASFDHKNMKVTFISVGQGDSALVEIPGGFFKKPHTILIDSGGFYGDSFDTGRNIIAPLLWNKRIRKIDTFILSHAQSDHMKGFNFLAGAFKPDSFLWNGVGDLKSLVKVLDREKLSASIIDKSREPLKVNEATITFLGPPPESKFVDINDNSLIFTLDYNGTTVLFTGDITERAEKALLNSEIDRNLYKNIDILKVPHHGSKYSSSKEFLSVTSPKYSLISLGRNNFFKFPHWETLKRLEKLNTELFRTDIDGAVEFTIGSKNIEIRTYSN